jgi:hypothetical protein
MKRINTHSTLVTAKHGLLVAGKYTKKFDVQKSSQYAYELQIQAPYAQGCAGTCVMATPSVLQFRSGNPASLAVSLVGGFGSYRDGVVPVTPTSSGQQKIELTASVTHNIGPLKLVDAFNVRVV